MIFVAYLDSETEPEVSRSGNQIGPRFSKFIWPWSDPRFLKKKFVRPIWVRGALVIYVRADRNGPRTDEQGVGGDWVLTFSVVSIFLVSVLSWILSWNLTETSFLCLTDRCLCLNWWLWCCLFWNWLLCWYRS